MSSFVPERPTLPPLRSLALPMHGVPSRLTLPSIQSDPHALQRRRQECVASPTSLHPPTPPPQSIAGPLTSTLYNSSYHPQYMHQANPGEPHVRLVLTDSFENADAALVLCSAGGSITSGAPRVISSPDALGSVKPGAPLLVVGPALERIRRPGTVLGKGMRMHPYRIVPASAPPKSSAAPGTYYAPRK